MFLGFCCWLTPITPTVLCVSTCSDGLLDFHNGGLAQRRFPTRPFAKSGAGCRPSISGWRSSCAGKCWLTGCTQRPRLGNHVRNFMQCFSTRLPGAAKRIPMKKKPTVDLRSKQSKQGGNNAKSGCYTSKVIVHHGSWTCMDFYRLSGARKKLLVQRLKHLWNIVQRGGRQKRALTSSSDVDSCQM